jgi:hypothetical protein
MRFGLAALSRNPFHIASAIGQVARRTSSPTAAQAAITWMTLACKRS